MISTEETWKGAEAAIAEFYKRFPGWWLKICVCHVSIDVDAAPDPNGPEYRLVYQDRGWPAPDERRQGSVFDEGVVRDWRQDGELTVASAVHATMHVLQMEIENERRIARKTLVEAVYLAVEDEHQPADEPGAK